MEGGREEERVHAWERGGEAPGGILERGTGGQCSCG